jgi:WD40 repeat protein
VQILRGRRHMARELAFSHCGRWLAAGGHWLGGLHVWDTAAPTAKPRQPNLGESGWTNALAFRPDGRLFFCSLDKWFLYDPAADALTELGSTPAWAIVPAPDASRVACIVHAAPLKTWAIPTKGKPRPELNVKLPGTTVTTAAFSPDGTTLVTSELKAKGGRRTLAVRDAATGRLRHALDFPNTSLPRLAFSRDGEYLFGWWDASIACWTLAEPEKPPRKGSNPGRKHFVSMADHPDGPLLTADNDRLVRVWDVPALTTDRTIEWKIGKLYAVAVSPDGTRAAVGSHTGRVLVWDWD